MAGAQLRKIVGLEALIRFSCHFEKTEGLGFRLQDFGFSKVGFVKCGAKLFV